MSSDAQVDKPQNSETIARSVVRVNGMTDRQTFIRQQFDDSVMKCPVDAPIGTGLAVPESAEYAVYGRYDGQDPLPDHERSAFVGNVGS